MKLGGVTHPCMHEASDSDRAPQTLPLIAVYDGRTFSRQSSADLDQVELEQRPTSRRTLSLRRKLLVADPNNLAHDRYVEQVVLLPQLIIINFLFNPFSASCFKLLLVEGFSAILV